MADGDGTVVLSQNFAGNLSIITPAFAPGRRGRLIIHNLDGTNRSLLWGAGTGVVASFPLAITLNAGTYTQIDWEFVYINAKAIFRYVVVDANRAAP
jgi:hypothetical protein